MRIFVTLLLFEIFLSACQQSRELNEVGNFTSKYKMDSVVGGTDCNIEHWKFFVQLRTQNTHICGATLLNSRWILTAAHCFAMTNFTISQIFAIAGLTSINKVNMEAVQISRLSKEYIHPLYSPKDIFSRHDVAIAKLEIPIKTTEYVKFVHLIKQTSSLTPLCAIGSVAGFGEQNVKIYLGGSKFLVIKNDYKPELQCVNLNIPPTKDCLQYASLVQYPTSFCALSNLAGKDTCQGDSGGPFMCGDIQVGITSRGLGCGMLGVAGAYTRVEFYEHFISYSMAQDDERSLETYQVPSKLLTATILLLNISRVVL